MTTYLEMIEDGSGDLVDIVYWHGSCAPARVREQGSWPCPESVDYPVYCGPVPHEDGGPGCGERVLSVGLTDEGLSEVCGREDYNEILTVEEKEYARQRGFLLYDPFDED